MRTFLSNVLLESMGDFFIDGSWSLAAGPCLLAAGHWSLVSGHFQRLAV
jgi:hypothetical protein